MTHTDGWRSNTGYDRQSMNLCWDHEFDTSTTIKTILGASKVDQQTGANSALPYALYQDNPTVNLRPPTYRKVDVFRVPSAIRKDLGQGEQLSITPFFRENRIDLNGSCNFTNGPSIINTSVQSFELMRKFRKNFDDSMHTQFITGIGVDHSPSRRQEDKIYMNDNGVAGLFNQYTGYTAGQRINDYKANNQSVAPYAHLKISSFERLRVIAGLRYDYARFNIMERQARCRASAVNQ